MTARVRGLDELERKLRPQLVGPPITRFFNRAAAKVQSRATVNAPMGVSGDLRKSIAFEVDSAVVPQWARIGTNLHYGPYVEFGTRPHWPPKGGGLALWAQRKGVDPDWIRWKIGRFGTKAQPYLKPALESSQADVDRYLALCAKEIEAEAAGGGA